MASKGVAMIDRVDTLIAGGGQAGLSVSYCLKRQGRSHLVLEQSDAPGNAWRNHRWDSFTLNTPNWQNGLPGAEYRGPNPDGFMTRDEVVAYLEQYVSALQLPVCYRTRVTSIELCSKRRSYLVQTNLGQSVFARNVVVATGLYQSPNIPSLSSDLPRAIRQVHSDAYRNPRELVPGAVLVVGSAQSGCQIAEELLERGKKVFLAVGRAGRVPRRYRGKDTCDWSRLMGLYERTVEDLPTPKAKFFAKPHVSGTRGGHTINLHQFARDGVVLLGRLQGVRDDGKVVLAPDLHENLAQADKFEAEFVRAIDEFIGQRGIGAPEERLPALRDGYGTESPAELDLAAAGITNVIWATSYKFDFALVRLPIFDSDGYPIQKRGVTDYPGLYFVGLPWLHDAKSGLIYGTGPDAEHVALDMAARNVPGAADAVTDWPTRDWLRPELCCA
jgi:putative flavoprotein involved in K+ transport